MTSASALLRAFTIAQAIAWAWSFRTWIKEGRARAWKIWIAPLSAAAIGASLAAILEAPYSPWDVVRLAPAAAFARGFPLYSGRFAGAILSTMYTPLSALAYLPAVLFRRPAQQAIAGRFIAWSLVFGPVWFFAANSSKDRLRRALIFAATVAACSFSPALWYSGTRIHADAPALSMLALTCWWETVPNRSRATGLLAATFAWLAVWCKQTMIALPVVLIARSFATLPTREAARRSSAILLVGALVSLPFAAGFDRDALYFNAVLWPGRFPWKGTFPANALFRGCELLAHASPWILVLIATRPRFARPNPDSRVALLCWIAIALAPLAILSRVKKGGDLNSFSPSLYPLVLACVARLATIRERPEISPRIVRFALTTAAVALALSVSLNVARELKLLAKERPADAEYDYLLNHPGEVYFPWHPLAHVAAEGRPTHHLHTVKERGVAGFPVGRDHFRRGLPETARYVAFPLKRFGPVVGFAWSFEQLRDEGLLDDDSRPLALKDLRDYECYRLKR